MLNSAIHSITQPFPLLHPSPLHHDFPLPQRSSTFTTSIGSSVQHAVLNADKLPFQTSGNVYSKSPALHSLADRFLSSMQIHLLTRRRLLAYGACAHFLPSKGVEAMTPCLLFRDTRFYADPLDDDDHPPCVPEPRKTVS